VRRAPRPQPAFAHPLPRGKIRQRHVIRLAPRPAGERTWPMSDATLLYRLFRPPGCPAADGEDLHRLAATAHADLLTRACADGGTDLGHALAPLRAFLAGVAPAAAKRRLLCHPLFIEGLHALAPLSDAPRHCHDSVAAATRS